MHYQRSYRDIYNYTVKWCLTLCDQLSGNLTKTEDSNSRSVYT